MLLELNVKAKREQRKEANFIWWDDEPTKQTELKKLMPLYDEYYKLSAAKLKAALLSGNYD